MREPIITSKGSRGRRTIATLTWAGLVLVAGVAWYGRGNGLVQSVSSEPVAFLLSAYAALSSIFAWMLYSPNRRSSDQSPALFISAAVTLLPPCIIAFCLMPSGSPYRFLLTLGVFILTMIAVSTPVPEEFFAVPRDRATYLRPISDAAFTQLRIEDRATGFENLASFSPRRSQLPLPDRPTSTAWPVEGRDPWDDPFHGTGISPVIPGSKARRSGKSEQIEADDRFAGQEKSKDFYPRSSLAGRPDTAESQRFDATHSTVSNERSLVPDARRGTQLPERPAPTYRPVSAERPSSGAAFGFRPPEASQTAIGTQAGRTPLSSPAAGQPRADQSLRTKSFHEETGFRREDQPSVRTQPEDHRGKSVRGVNSTQSASVTARNPAGGNPSQITPAGPLAPVILPSPATRSTLAEDSNTESLRDTAFRQWAGDSLLTPSDGRSAPSDGKLAPSLGKSEASTASQRTAQGFAFGTEDRDQSFAGESRDRQSRLIDHEGAVQQAAGTASASDIPDLHVERIRDEYGGEMVEGTARIRFLAGQKKVNVHVPFAPALPGIPEVECESVGDQVLRLKVPVRQPYGIRIEARRSDASAPLETEIGFAAVYSPPNRRV